MTGAIQMTRPVQLGRLRNSAKPAVMVLLFAGSTAGGPSDKVPPPPPPAQFGQAEVLIDTLWASQPLGQTAFFFCATLHDGRVRGTAFNPRRVEEQAERFLVMATTRPAGADGLDGPVQLELGAAGLSYGAKESPVQASYTSGTFRLDSSLELITRYLPGGPLLAPEGRHLSVAGTLTCPVEPDQPQVPDAVLKTLEGVGSRKVQDYFSSSFESRTSYRGASVVVERRDAAKTRDALRARLPGWLVFVGADRGLPRGVRDGPSRSNLQDFSLPIDPWPDTKPLAKPTDLVEVVVAGAQSQDAVVHMRATHHWSFWDQYFRLQEWNAKYGVDVLVAKNEGIEMRFLRPPQGAELERLTHYMHLMKGVYAQGLSPAEVRGRVSAGKVLKLLPN